MRMKRMIYQLALCRSSWTMNPESSMAGSAPNAAASTSNAAASTSTAEDSTSPEAPTSLIVFFHKADEKPKGPVPEYLFRAQCKICQQRFPYKAALNHHIAAAHREPKENIVVSVATDTQKCSYCEQSFDGIDALNAHCEEKHSGQVCPYSRKKKCRQRRDVHIKKEHQEEPQD